MFSSKDRENSEYWLNVSKMGTLYGLNLIDIEGRCKYKINRL